jgi:polar amino acid transport system substrate-binding protein
MFGSTKKELENAKIIKENHRENETIFELINYHKKHLKSLKSLNLKAIIIEGIEETSVQIILDFYKSNVIVLIRDISQELIATKCNHRDILTNLPNQSQAMLDIGLAITKANTTNSNFGLILISIDHFYGLRAILGYRATDMLIGKIVEAFKYFTKEINSRVYQMTRSNFLFIVPDITTQGGTIKLIEELQSDMSKLVDFDSQYIDLTFSAGVSFYPDGGTGVDMLIDNLYKALANAQEEGRGKIVVYKDSQPNRDIEYELGLFSEMNLALKENQFELFYQPFIDIQTGDIRGAEALIRWRHPQKGLISPANFIPLAEKTGFIIELGKFVITEVIKQQKKWELFEFNKLPISINLTLREIETGDMVSFTESLLQKYQIDPSLLEFEIRENISMINTAVAKREFVAFKNLGVSLSLDDFGTGYASFSYLRDFPLDTLKIDLSFVKNIINNKEHQKIVKAMIDLGHNFDLKVIAEGVEDDETHELLKSYGCDEAQGYYFSKPLPAFEFQELIRKEI